MTDTISIPTTKNKPRLLPPAIRSILIACLVAGTLDISYALIMWGPVFGKMTASRLLQGIAGALVGKDALTGGFPMTLLGLAMHYCISLAWVIIYFFIFPFISHLSRNKWISGVLYGAFVWAMMTLVIVPLITGRAWRYDTVPFLKSIAPMILLFGPAIAFIVQRPSKPGS